MEEAELRAALQQRQSAIRGWRCPDETRLAAYADAGLNEAERAQIAGHLADCSFCRDQVAVLARLADRPAPDVPGPLLARAVRLVAASTGARRSPGWRWALGSAAAAALVFALVSLRPIGSPSAGIPSTPSPEPRVLRQTPPVTAGPAIEFPQEGATVAPGDLEFRWTAREGVLFYDVRILTDAGDVVFQQRAEGTSLRVPPTTALSPSRKYYVWVSGYLTQDKILKSAPVGFEIASKP